MRAFSGGQISAAISASRSSSRVRPDRLTGAAGAAAGVRERSSVRLKGGVLGGREAGLIAWNGRESDRGKSGQWSVASGQWDLAWPFDPRVAPPAPAAILDYH